MAEHAAQSHHHRHHSQLLRTPPFLFLLSCLTPLGLLAHRTNVIDGTADAGDCDGHGTTVGGIALGRNVGVAKEASLVAVRVLDCQARWQHHC